MVNSYFSVKERGQTKGTSAICYYHGPSVIGVQTTALSDPKIKLIQHASVVYIKTIHTPWCRASDAEEWSCLEQIPCTSISSVDPN